jgi:hypothetical protein
VRFSDRKWISKRTGSKPKRKPSRYCPSGLHFA